MPPVRASDYTTMFTYDVRGDLTDVVLPTGAVYRMTYDSNGNRLAVMDDQGSILSSDTYGPGGVVTSDGDAFGTLTFTYDSSGNAVEETDSLGTHTMTYAADGQLTSLTDPDGVTSTYQYDRRGVRPRLTTATGSWPVISTVRAPLGLALTSRPSDTSAVN